MRGWLRVALGVGLVLAALGATAVVAADDEPDRNAADVGFLQDMIDHHDQANQLSAVALAGDASEPVRNLALDVIASQRYEIGVMEGWLIQWGLDRGAPGREVMAWMGMPTPIDDMPGMASAGAIAGLSRLRGSDLDVRYLELLLDHHEGGVHMATEAAERGADPHVRWLAEQMARNQRREIREIETLLAG